MDIVYDILTTLAGIATFAVTVSLIEQIGRRLTPVPAEARQIFDDRELMSRSRKGDAEARAALTRAMDMTGTGSQLMIVIGWTVGTAAGTLVAGSIDSSTVLMNSFIIAGFNILGVFFVGRMLPHPPWMAALGYILPTASAHFTAMALEGFCFTC